MIVINFFILRVSRAAIRTLRLAMRLCNKAANRRNCRRRLRVSEGYEKETEILRMRFLKTSGLIALAVISSTAFANGQTFLQDLDPGSLTEGVFGDIVYTQADPFEPPRAAPAPSVQPDRTKGKTMRRHGSAAPASR